MDYSISSITIDNFKSYASLQKINISDLSVFLGANSSGKSTALQALLAIKQTMECNSRDIELLLSGQYVALGDFDDVIYDKSRSDFSLGIDFKCAKTNETTDSKDAYGIKWFFEKAEDKFQALLSKVEISYEDMCVSFDRKSLNKYQMTINSEATPLYANIRNLSMTGDLFLKYDMSFNKIFADFINEIKELVEGKKSKKMAINSLVSLRIVPDIYMGLLNDASSIKEERRDIEIEELADKLTSLIEAFSLFQNPLGSEYYGLPFDMKKSCILAIIINSGKKDEFRSVYEKYSGIFEKYKVAKAPDVSMYEGEELLRRFMVMHSDGNNRNKFLDAYYWVNDFYDSFETVINRLFFVGPIRENPQGLYNIGFEQEPKYVGPTGSNFASVLLHENKIKNYVLPYDEEDKMLLCDALNEWAAHLNIASAVKVSHATSFGIKVSVSDTQNKTADIMNVGIGTSQVLPVLITGLLSEEGETLLFEQPELHLHPFSQSRLADFFVALIKRGRKIIIETHSEAFILRLRYHILKENCDKSAIAINFFQNKQGTKVSMCNISGYGNIDYPEDFRDETQELLNDLMNAALKKDTK